MKGAPSDWTDETSAKLPKLAPVKHSSFNMQRDMVLNFGKEVTGYYLDKTTNKKLRLMRKLRKTFRQQYLSTIDSLASVERKLQNRYCYLRLQSYKKWRIKS